MDRTNKREQINGAGLIIDEVGVSRYAGAPVAPGGGSVNQHERCGSLFRQHHGRALVADGEAG
jgi:hypothetical protein